MSAQVGQSRWHGLLVNAALLAMALVSIAPLLWMTSVSFMPAGEASRFPPPLLPSALSASLKGLAPCAPCSLFGYSKPCRNPECVLNATGDQIVAALRNLLEKRNGKESNKTRRNDIRAGG